MNSSKQELGDHLMEGRGSVGTKGSMINSDKESQASNHLGMYLKNLRSSSLGVREAVERGPSSSNLRKAKTLL